MRFEIERGVLSEMLSAVVNLLPNRTTYTVLLNVLVEVADGKLRLSGTDLDTFVRKETALEGKTEEGRVVLPGRKLAEICREMGGATMLLHSKEMTVHAESAGAKTRFSGLDPAEYPEMPKMPEGAALDFPIPGVLELLDAVSFAISRDESRPAMTGVNWEVSKTAMKMVATDGHRLGYVSRKGKFSSTFRQIVSARFLSLLPRSQETVSVRQDPGRIALSTADTLAIGRPIEGPYPDYDRVLPRSEHPYKAVLDHEPFSAALRRAAVFANPVGRLTSLAFSAGKVKIQAETSDVGSSEEELGCEYTGEPLKIGFNVGYVLEILRRIPGDKIVLELQNPNSAGIFKPHEKNPEMEMTYLVMPIRLD